MCMILNCKRSNIIIRIFNSFPLVPLNNTIFESIELEGPVISPMPACAASAGLYPKASIISCSVGFSSDREVGTTIFATPSFEPFHGSRRSTPFF